MTDLDSSRFTFASIGLGSAVVTDAKLYEDALAVTTHTEDGFQLYIVQLDIRGRQVKQVQTQAFHNGEVTSLSLWHRSGALYAVACLWRDKAVHLDFHCITSSLPVKSIALQDRKWDLTIAIPLCYELISVFPQWLMLQSILRLSRAS